LPVSQTSTLHIQLQLQLGPWTAAMSLIADGVRSAWNDKQTHVVMFSATAIALYGYDQGTTLLAPFRLY